MGGTCSRRSPAVQSGHIQLRGEALGGGPFLHLVDPLWRHATSPYGPAWERLSGWIVALSGHSVLGSVLGFRLVAVIGVALLAWAVPVLARSIGRDPSTALVLAVLNPVVVLVLVGGSHNDALMLGLLASGMALASRRHVVPGLVLCALAAEVKAPALIGAAYIGWAWVGADVPVRRRLVKTVLAVSFVLGVMAVIGALSGLSWRWVGDVLGAGTVRSWLDPATALGLVLAHLARALGSHAGSGGFVRATRGIGLGAAAVVSIRLLVRSDRTGALEALGWSLLAFVLLGPIIWPWYETWGFVFLALVAEGWVLVLLVTLSVIACFADVPSPHLLIDGPPALVVVSWTALVGLVALCVTTWRTRQPRLGRVV
ncbi:MAG: polyprenol phosphomannose-dependent alpha 1,6 mannosyltransferase MptB [Acidimicrobiales bacterium]